MTGDYRELFRAIAQRPSMYLPGRTGVSLDSYIAYVDGYCGGQAVAIGEYPLDGFREWLILKVGGGNNLIWWGLAQQFIEGENEQDRMLSLNELMEEFFVAREDIGINQINTEFNRWLKSRRWYSKADDRYLRKVKHTA